MKDDEGHYMIRLNVKVMRYKTFYFLIPFFMMILFFQTLTWAREQTLLKCLGQEEARLHQLKSQGPVYFLNQEIIEMLIQFKDIQLHPQYIKTLCSPEKGSVSLRILEFFLSDKKDLFIVKKKSSSTQKDATSNTLSELQKAFYHIFLSYISHIQAIAPSADCLKKEIRLLDQLFLEVNYLEGEVEQQSIYKNKAYKIFTQLKDYENLFQRCRRRTRKKEK